MGGDMMASEFVAEQLRAAAERRYVERERDEGTRCDVCGGVVDADRGLYIDMHNECAW